MSDRRLRSDLIRLASELPKGSPERRKILAVLRDKAGTTESFLGVSSWAGVFNKQTALVNALRIKSLMEREKFPVDDFDFTKIEWGRIDKADHFANSKGVEVVWRVFPHGEFGNRNSDYVYGTVATFLEVTSKGVKVTSMVSVVG